MKKLRATKDTDQQDIEKGFQMILKLMDDHKEIEATLWGGVLWSLLANGYKNCDFSYEEFENEVKNILEHYRHWWED